ncbi:MAG: NPCBM/NEW2 domain-containing protein [Bacteroidales bacterium]|nr:NPCBM/NEW2 domain-containing protein [Bacteroidales bacterium]MDT8430420.1 NPCBM/NEW2 domain-containing protein [Bacteroidales bacterium]
MKALHILTFISIALLAGCITGTRYVIWLDETDITKMETGWGTSKVNQSIDGNVLTIAGMTFERGIGTHAISKLLLELDGKGKKFIAEVGLDDETEHPDASVKFYVLGDKEILWQSGSMTAADSARRVDVDITGIDKLALLVLDGGNGINYDHADWANARIEAKCESIKSIAITGGDAAPYILTPSPPATPRINGPQITGASPGKPFMFKVPVTGDRPLRITASNLPNGLGIDEATGLISGRAEEEGRYEVIIHAENEKGTQSRPLQIVIGKHQLALTPPMGWNSWNVWACSIDQEKTLAAAEAMVTTGLIEHGWTYINIDDCWEAAERTSGGELLCNDKFPDIQTLADQIHDMGLKIGIYSSPGPTTCQNYHGSWQHELQDVQTWADWGIDYLKYDWCGYSQVVEDSSLDAYKKPYFVMREALDRADRDIVYSICQYGMRDVYKWGSEVGGDLWRTTGDIVDTWNSMFNIGFSQEENAPYAGPSGWNDPDMLVVGQLGWGPNLHPTRLSPDEQYTHISMWSLLSAPLLIGCDITQMDAFTLNLLTNDEVISVNQDMLGRQAVPVSRRDGIEIWVKELYDGSKAVGVFYTGGVADDPVDMFNWDNERKSRKVMVAWSDLRMDGTLCVRDLWRQEELGYFTGGYETEVPYHGVSLLKISAKQ